MRNNLFTLLLCALPVISACDLRFVEIIDMDGTSSPDQSSDLKESPVDANVLSVEPLNSCLRPENASNGFCRFTCQDSCAWTKTRDNLTIKTIDQGSSPCSCFVNFRSVIPGNTAIINLYYQGQLCSKDGSIKISVNANPRINELSSEMTITRHESVANPDYNSFFISAVRPNFANPMFPWNGDAARLDISISRQCSSVDKTSNLTMHSLSILDKSAIPAKLIF